MMPWIRFKGGGGEEYLRSVLQLEYDKKQAPLLCMELTGSAKEKSKRSKLPQDEGLIYPMQV